MPPPPKPPPPQVVSSTHYSIELTWAEFVDRIHEVQRKEDGRICCEVQTKKTGAEDWETNYTGYDGRCNATELLPLTSYDYRMRFRNNSGWSAFSEAVSVTTKKPPLTGQDIHKALRMNSEYELQKVLDKAQANVEAPDPKGYTPLMVAGVEGKVALMRMLLDYGANPDNVVESDKTALMLSAFKNQMASVELLVEAKASVNKQDRNGNTALHYAVDGESPDMVKFLCERGADANLSDYQNGWTPLMRCAGLKNNGNPRVAKELVKRGAKLNARDAEGRTALFVAAMNGHHAMCDTLLSCGADASVRSTGGISVLEVAESMERRHVVQVLKNFTRDGKRDSAPTAAAPAASNKPAKKR